MLLEGEISKILFVKWMSETQKIKQHNPISYVYLYGIFWLFIIYSNIIIVESFTNKWEDRDTKICWIYLQN